MAEVAKFQPYTHENVVEGGSSTEVLVYRDVYESGEFVCGDFESVMYYYSEVTGNLYLTPEYGYIAAEMLVAELERQHIESNRREIERQRQQIESDRAELQRLRRVYGNDLAGLGADHA